MPLAEEPEIHPDHVTPYDRLAWSDAEVEQLLVSGEHPRELAAYFGEQEYRELVRLARRARSTPLRRRAARVVVVPGIMGSQLGRPRRRPLPNDVLWLDPVDIAVGRLTLLRLPGSAPIVSLGAVLYTYLRLKLHLRAAGFDPLLYHYDWRLDIARLGAELAALLRREEATAVVAHSMGGLVTRAALAHDDAARVERIVLLGVPNFGSFAAVQALRGTYAVVRKIARLDLRHSAEELADHVFNTFPSLYQLLPAAGHGGGIDLFDPTQWPASGPRPRPELLESARVIERVLVPADERFAVIVGVEQETVTAVARERGEFVYTITRHGDGTVPVACAVLPGARTYYTATAHSELARSAVVAEAVADLLRSGATRRLATEWTRRGIAQARIGDGALRRTHVGKVDWAGLEPEERRVFLQTLNEPPRLRLKAPAAAPSPRAAARRRAAAPAARLEVQVAVQDIVHARADALVVAVFEGVRPAGALAAIDTHLDGLVAEFSARRMLPGEAGNVMAIPAHGRLPHASQVLLAGIGRFDRLSERTIEFTAENVVRLCARSGIGSIATVLWGHGASFPAEASGESQLRGYLRGLAAADHDAALRRIVFCVRDRMRQRRLAAACRRVLTAEPLPGRQIVLREAPAARRRGRAARVRIETVTPTTAYLLVNEVPIDSGAPALRAAVLTAGRHAAVIAESVPVPHAALAAHLAQLASPTLSAARLAAFGERLAELTLHETVRGALYGMRERPLVVVHDAAASRIPWETLCIRGWSPAAEAGLSRRYAAEQLSLARFSESRRRREELAVLLVANPTEDLPGAELERERLLALLRPQEDVRVTVVRGAAATRARVLAELQSGAYDLLHYAGHAFFDEKAPARSGIRLCDGELRGLDLAELAQLPALVVVNACESGRLRRDVPAADRRQSVQRRMRESHGLAEAFLRSGIANYIGTYWPVSDAAALAFADAFYASLVRRATLGRAVVEARAAVRATRSIDWADYVHYGDPDFRLKE